LNQFSEKLFGQLQEQIQNSYDWQLLWKKQIHCQCLLPTVAEYNELITDPVLAVVCPQLAAVNTDLCEMPAVPSNTTSLVLT
jgi:hypothetical protein